MLTTDEKVLLDVVFETVGDNENMIRDGIIKALHGVNDKARRTYLWNVLLRAAKERIRQARRNAEFQRLKKMLTEGILSPQKYLEQCAAVRDRQRKDVAWNRGLDTAIKQVLRQK